MYSALNPVQRVQSLLIVVPDPSPYEKPAWPIIPMPYSNRKQQHQ